MRANNSPMMEQFTTRPFEENSCMACWNKPTTAQTGPFAPRAHGMYHSVPVHLTDKTGRSVLLCYAAKCMNCGHLKQYGAKPGIYKPGIGFNFANWPELVQNNIDPIKFEKAISEYPAGRPIWLNAAELQNETKERAPFYEPRDVLEGL